MSTITSANSSFTLKINNLYPTPQKVEGYAADAAFAFDETQIAEVIIGVDGKLSAGFTFALQKQTVSIQADSPSLSMFSNWYTAMFAARDIYWAEGVIILPSIGRKYTLKKGTLTGGKPMPDAKKTLSAQEFKITWEEIIGEDYNG